MNDTTIDWIEAAHDSALRRVLTRLAVRHERHVIDAIVGMDRFDRIREASQ